MDIDTQTTIDDAIARAETLSLYMDRAEVMAVLVSSGMDAETAYFATCAAFVAEELRKAS